MNRIIQFLLIFIILLFPGLSFAKPEKDLRIIYFGSLLGRIAPFG